MDSFHSVLHLLLNMVPSSMDMVTTKGSSSSMDKESNGPSDDSRDGNEEVSEIILPHNDSKF